MLCCCRRSWLPPHTAAMRVACVLLTVALAACAVTATAKKPWFCHDLDCPKYTVGESNEDYEVRTYAKGACAC